MPPIEIARGQYGAGRGRVDAGWMGGAGMGGVTAIRLAAVIALGYGLWVLLGGPVHVGAGSDALTMRVSFTQVIAWAIGLAAIVIGASLWARFAWAWWLGLAAALFQLWRLAYPLFAAQRLPGVVTLVVLLALVMFVVLLFLPKARAACSR
jgi:hypothetical protein